MPKPKRLNKTKLSSLSMRLRLITVALFMLVGSYFLYQASAAAGYIYINPGSANRYVNDVFAVQVRISSTAPINAAFVDINYNGIGLQVVSIARGADFPNQNAQTEHTPSSTGTGRIRMQSTRNNAATGDFHYATITFRATKTGTYGVSPINTSRLINYPSNEVSYTFGRGDYNISNTPVPVVPPPPPAPAPPTPSRPNPSPTPSPSPSPSPASRPRPSTAPTSNVPQSQSAPSASSLQISNFSITNIGYRSALATWTTNKPSSSKVNYGFSANDMSNELNNESPVTTHSVAIQGDTVRAGKHYYVRVTSNDGAGPVTLDGDFETRSIPIAVLVTDDQNKPISGATVFADKAESSSNEQGIADLSSTEGTLYISAKKDDLSGDVDVQVNLPESDEAAPQQFTVALRPATANNTKVPAKDKKGSSWWKIVLPLFGGTAILGAIIVIRRRRGRLPQSTASYHTPGVTVMTEPTGAHPSHHTTLPELVMQDLSAKGRKANPHANEPEDMFSALDRPAPAAPPPIHQVTPEHHTPKPEPKAPEPPAHHDEPKAPPAEKHEPPEKHEAPPKPEHPPAHHKEVEIDPKDHSLRIHHDK